MKFGWIIFDDDGFIRESNQYFTSHYAAVQDCKHILESIKKPLIKEYADKVRYRITVFI